MGRRRVRALALAAELVAADIVATTNLTAASAAAPCVLVPPPTLDAPTYAGMTITWGLIALAGAGADPDLAWDQVDDLVDKVAAVFPIERADPIAYALPDGATHPAYRLTLVESE